METERLKRFIIGFKTEALPLLKEDNTGISYIISQSLSEDPLVRDIANLKPASGQLLGEFMGVPVTTEKDFAVRNYRDQI